VTLSLRIFADKRQSGFRDGLMDGVGPSTPFASYSEFWASIQRIESRSAVISEVRICFSTCNLSLREFLWLRSALERLVDIDAYEHAIKSGWNCFAASG